MKHIDVTGYAVQLEQHQTHLQVLSSHLLSKAQQLEQNEIGTDTNNNIVQLMSIDNLLMNIHSTLDILSDTFKRIEHDCNELSGRHAVSS
jgi:hypothetical protein